LQATLPRVGPGWSLSLFGSSANGFGVRGSDIDLTCLRDLSSSAGAGARPDAARRSEEEGEKGDVEKGAEEEEAQEGASREEAESKEEEEGGGADREEALQKEEPEHEEPEAVLRERWQPLLEAHPRFAVMEEVLSAKVPILKVQYDGCLDIDLSCQNVQALQNTRLLQAYSKMHPKVRELVIAVKLWAKAAQVCGASQRHLSSYTFTLMTIYFLQVTLDVQLPTLPTSAFEPDGKGEDDPEVQKAQAGWSIRQSTAELLVNFFLFYNFCFAWGLEVVSPRLGSRHAAQEETFERLRGRWAQRLHVEDPYLLDRNLHCVLGDREEMQLRTAFADALHALQYGLSPPGLRPSAALAEDAAAEQEKEVNEARKTGAAKVEKTKKLAEVAGALPRGGECIVAGALSGGSAGSTASSAGCNEACCDDGEAESSAAESRGLSTSDDDRATSKKGEQAAVKDGGPFQWWRHLGSASVAEAVGPAKAKVASTSGDAQHGGLNVRDLEAAIRKKSGGGVPHSASPLETRHARSLMGNAFIGRSTGGIAARVDRLCLGQLKATAAAA